MRVSGGGPLYQLTHPPGLLLEAASIPGERHADAEVRGPVRGFPDSFAYKFRLRVRKFGTSDTGELVPSIGVPGLHSTVSVAANSRVKNFLIRRWRTRGASR